MRHWRTFWFAITDSLRYLHQTILNNRKPSDSNQPRNHCLSPNIDQHFHCSHQIDPVWIDTLQYKRSKPGNPDVAEAFSDKSQLHLCSLTSCSELLPSSVDSPWFQQVGNALETAATHRLFDGQCGKTNEFENHSLVLSLLLVSPIHNLGYKSDMKICINE